MASEAAIVVFNVPAEVSSATAREGFSSVKARGSDDDVAPKAREREDFERLMKAHEQRVFRAAWRLLGRREDAQDAAQEVFLRLYRYRHRFDERRPLEPWLYRITVNVCRDLRRRRRVRQTASLEELEETRPLVSADPDPGAAARIAEERRIVEQALATLAEKERAALVLRDVQGLSTAEVAEILGSSQVTVRSQISRARLKIKKYRDRKLGGSPR